MHQTQSQSRFMLLLGVALALMAGLALAISVSVQAANPPNQPFDLIYTATDVKYRGLQEGIGMFEQTAGTLTDVTVGGPVVKAYLLWAGLGQDVDGVAFQRNQEAATPVMFDYVWNNATFNGGPTWLCCGEELSVYAADITETGIVTQGVNSYTLSEMNIEHTVGGATVAENLGYSLLVVYEDPTFTATRRHHRQAGQRWSIL